MTDLDGASAAVAGPVWLRLPPEPRMSRVLRLAAGGLASLSGFTVDDIDDLKIAVSEILVVLVRHGVGAPIDMDIDVDQLGLRIHACTTVARIIDDDPDLELSRVLLDSVCEFHEIGMRGREAHLHAVLLRSV